MKAQGCLWYFCLRSFLSMHPALGMPCIAFYILRRHRHFFKYPNFPKKPSFSSQAFRASIVFPSCTLLPHWQQRVNLPDIVLRESFCIILFPAGVSFELNKTKANARDSPSGSPQTSQSRRNSLSLRSALCLQNQGLRSHSGREGRGTNGCC